MLWEGTRQWQKEKEIEWWKSPAKGLILRDVEILVGIDIFALKWSHLKIVRDPTNYLSNCGAVTLIGSHFSLKKG